MVCFRQYLQVYEVSPKKWRHTSCRFLLRPDVDGYGDQPEGPRVQEHAHGRARSGYSHSHE